MVISQRTEEGGAGSCGVQRQLYCVDWLGSDLHPQEMKIVLPPQLIPILSVSYVPSFLQPHLSSSYADDVHPQGVHLMALL